MNKWKENKLTFPDSSRRVPTGSTSTLLKMKATTTTSYAECVSLIPSLSKTSSSLPLFSAPIIDIRGWKATGRGQGRKKNSPFTSRRSRNPTSLEEAAKSWKLDYIYNHILSGRANNVMWSDPRKINKRKARGKKELRRDERDFVNGGSRFES